ncbi:hypothetical protein O5O45_05305 [Hahella aquimaris]|uniref:hypothetical protein n=1 Tax=Hahella sp. HNIBRBA332 TaxID=3015983 RepID=UPI00273B5B0B|nr:hypothetical protein [Hahella sp. HNIBRBA332]WLQ15335.1 hypothetical protein O5O45_05305 [Hahella sp. HNIBRBA332]
MPEIHIEEFYKDAAKVLIQLYNSFPRKSAVFVEDISGADTPDEFGLHSVRHQACFAAMIWLSEEGLIRFVDTIRQEAIDQAVLTQPAFLKLNSLAVNQAVSPTLQRFISALEESGDATPNIAMSNIQLIKKALHKATSTQLAELMQCILFAPAQH